MPVLNFNIFNIIILAGIIQGLIFGFFLLFSKRGLKGNTYLACTVICLTLNNLQYWLSDSNLTTIIPELGYLYLPFELLMIPAFFFFVSHYLDYTLTKNNKILLIFPFVFSTIFHSIIAIDSFLFKNQLINLKFRNFYFISEEYFSFVYSFLLIISILRNVRHYEKSDFSITKVKAKTKWLKHILFIGLILCIFWIVIIYLMGNNNIFGFKLYYPLWISISFLIYWISYSSSINYSLLLERKNIRNEILSESLIVREKKQFPDNKNIYTKFEVCVQNSYTNPLLSIEDIAEELNISSNYLSQIINQKNIKFSTYINNLRIRKAKEMLSDETFSKYTITSIGLEAGFNSKASFYRAFKTYTGQTPVEFRDSIKIK